MAVVIYRCSGCNRLLHLRENERGLTTIGLCTLTKGCSGQLIQIDRLQDATIPPLAETVPDVEDRQPRNVLYNHVQGIVSDVWTITHNLGTNPVVQVAVDRPDQEDRIEIEPELVEIVDKNTTRITFSRAESGIAQFISRSSSSAAITTTIVAEPERFQLTTAGIMTVATLTTAANIGIRYVVDGVETPQSYPVTYPPVSVSPWSDATTVVVKGREYYIGSIDTSGAIINEGASFFFDDAVYPASDMFLPLALSPFNIVDKVKRRVIFPEGIGAAESISSFVYTQSEHAAVDTIIEDVYPPVFVV